MSSFDTGRRLARFADPSGINNLWRPRPMKPGVAAIEGGALLRQATAHNVFPSVARNLEAELRTAPEFLVSGRDATAEAARQKIVADARQIGLTLLARNMMLADVARTILARAAEQGLPVVLVKGLDFAEQCYGGVPMRAFSDIDLLVRPDAAPALAALVEAEDFQAVVPTEKRTEYTERQFVRKDPVLEQMLVEVHTDLAHAPKLRQHASLTYETYAGSASGGVTMAARLVLAGIHGAMSHLFDRLQYMTDMIAIVRRGVDPAELRSRVDETGSLLAVRTGLDLAIRIFGCPQCRELLSAMPEPRYGWLAPRLLTPATVIGAWGPNRGIHSWRRQMFRVLMTMQPEV